MSEPDPRELSRTDDPETSHKAAREIVEEGMVGRMMKVALERVKARPGSTAAELGGGPVRKRLNDLRKLGLVYNRLSRPCSVTGRHALTWYPSPSVTERHRPSPPGTLFDNTPRYENL